jgi:hypothetical protein
MQVMITTENLRMIESSGPPQEQIVDRIGATVDSQFPAQRRNEKGMGCATEPNVIQTECNSRTIAEVTSEEDTAGA